MKVKTLPLLELFLRLREAGLPLGIDDYQLVLRALQSGFGIPTRSTLARLCRTLWAKSDEESSLLDDYFEQLIPETYQFIEEGKEAKSPLGDVHDEQAMSVLGMTFPDADMELKDATPPAFSPQFGELQTTVANVLESGIIRLSLYTNIATRLAILFLASLSVGIVLVRAGSRVADRPVDVSVGSSQVWESSSSSTESQGNSAESVGSSTESEGSLAESAGNLVESADTLTESASDRSASPSLHPPASSNIGAGASNATEMRPQFPVSGTDLPEQRTSKVAADNDANSSNPYQQTEQQTSQTPTFSATHDTSNQSITDSQNSSEQGDPTAASFNDSPPPAPPSGESPSSLSVKIISFLTAERLSNTGTLVTRSSGLGLALSLGMLGLIFGLKLLYSSIKPEDLPAFKQDKPLLEQSTSIPPMSSTIAQAHQDELQVVYRALQSLDVTQGVSDNPFLDLKDYAPITRRQMKQGWRHLRRLVREGPRTELDLEATVQQIGRDGFLLNPVLIPLRVNRAKLVLLADQEGSMVPFHRLTHRFVDTAQLTGLLGRADTYYFHNCPDQHLYYDPLLQTGELIDDFFKESIGRQTMILIHSDAGAARGGFNPDRVHSTRRFLERLQQVSSYIVWLNPMSCNRWSDTTAEELSQLVPMFEVSRQGFQDAIDVLRGRHNHVSHRSP